LLTKDLLNINFTGIKNTIEKLTNITFPKYLENYIYDYSLLNPKIKSDNLEIDIEKMYFNNFYNFPIHGEKISPYSIKNITKRLELASTFNIWSRDKLPTFVDMMNENIKSKFLSIQIYHCMQGVDRTGEIIGAYKMKIFKKCLKEIIQEDTKINQGKLAPKIHNLNALEWYELYLKK